jgi:tetratricopeptide (TPR) repeat protein
MIKKFIRELRRREVFRASGLYVGVAWLIIEISVTILPTFGAPEWVLQAMIIIAVIGFPVAVVLAWIYDFTDHGIVVQGDPTDTIVPPIGSRKMDFVVIGVLLVALMVSVYLNVTGGPDVVEEHPPVSVIIADFLNETGDPVFDGSIEQALQIGLEGASFITAYDRPAGRAQIERLRPDNKKLDESGARLIAVREGIQLVLSGSVREDGGRYEFIVHAIDADSGEQIIDVDKKAADKLGVLGSVAEIAEEIREELGDTSFEEESLRGTETFTASSLEAAKAYTEAQELAYRSENEAAAELYRKAVELDPDFGRAYSGWALAAFNLGRDAEAEELWQKAVELMDTMTDRERYRTLGLYYVAVSQNYPKAIESYESLVENYPADGAGHNNLGIAYFATLDFKRALEEGRRTLDIYPNNLVYQYNFALYAMFVGEFDLADESGRAIVATDASRYYAWLPVAIAELSRGNIDAATDAYDQMAATGPAGASLANLGLADIELFRGEFGKAAELLQQGIEMDVDAGNSRSAATKYIVLAEALARLGDEKESMQAIADSLAIRQGLARQVPAALLYLEHGHVDKARDIGEDLSQQIQTQRRAYGTMILGIIDMQEGRHADAVGKLTAAIGYSDHWLIRFYLGRAYLEAGSAVEAMDEFEILAQRRGEASALFLDDLPTWRYLATLPYWQGRAHDAMGVYHSAREKYATFISQRPAGDPLAADARQRMAAP